MKSLTNTAILELLTNEQQVELFKILQEKLPEEDNSVRKKLGTIMDMYCDLVWLARSNPNTTDPAVIQARYSVIGKYPKEFEELREEGDWRHGFNSGMLACARLIFPYSLPYNYRDIHDDGSGDPPVVFDRNYEISNAEEEFPELST